MSSSPPVAPSNAPAPQRLWILDLARAPAALGVIGFHSFLSAGVHHPPDATLFWVGWLRHGGVFGVCLFFFLSGFGIHLASLRRGTPASWPDFWRRRLQRLYPAYAATIVFAAGLNILWPLMHGRPALRYAPGIWNLTTHLLLIQTWWPETFFGIVPALWFVGVVAQMYLLYPLFILLCRRWTETGAVSVALAVTLAWRLAAAHFADANDPETYACWWMNAPARWFEWCLGAWMARAIVDGRRVSWQVGLPCLAGLLIWMPAGERVPVLYEPLLIVLLGTCLWTLCSTVRRSGPPAAYQSVFLIAETSYAAYLLHQIFLPFVASAVPPARESSALLCAILFVLVCLVTFPAAWLLHRWVERPFSTAPALPPPPAR